MGKGRQLKDILASNRGVLIPGAYDALSARLIERAGFDAVFGTGFGITGSYLAKPDAGLLSMHEMLAMTRCMVNATKVPVIADIDTGYGNAINAIRAVNEFEAVGAGGVLIDDETMPEKCPWLGLETQLISIGEMTAKLRAMAEHRHDRDFLIMVRVSVLMTKYDKQGEFVKESLKRGVAYAEAGADIIMFQGRSRDELAELGSAWRKLGAPCPLASVMNLEKTNLTITELESIGFLIGMPVTNPLFAAAKAVKDLLGRIRGQGSLHGTEDVAMPISEFLEIVDLESLKADSIKYGFAPSSSV